VFPDYVAVRLTAAVVGTIGVLGAYRLGERLFNNSWSAFALAVSLSFAWGYFLTTSSALLDGVAETFLILGFVFLVRMEATNTAFNLNLVLCGLLLGLAFASKLLAITGILVAVSYLMALRGLSIKNKLSSVILLGICVLVVFMLVQPRMWFDPLARFYETFSKNLDRVQLGHPVPINVLPGGNNSWVGKRVFPPPLWTVPWWVLTSSSAFVLVGLILLITSLRKSRLKDVRSPLMFGIISAIVPLTYIVAEWVYLPQYLPFIELGVACLAVTGYASNSRIRSRVLALLSATTFLAIVEEILYMTGGFDFLFTPVWFQFLQWPSLLGMLLCARLFRYSAGGPSSRRRPTEFAARFVSHKCVKPTVPDAGPI
jgi:dolichyl-phosphate-mannose--protein O-mannosyl transferase